MDDEIWQGWRRECVASISFFQPDIEDSVCRGVAFLERGSIAFKAFTDTEIQALQKHFYDQHDPENHFQRELNQKIQIMKKQETFFSPLEVDFIAGLLAELLPQKIQQLFSMSEIIKCLGKNISQVSSQLISQGHSVFFATEQKENSLLRQLAVLAQHLMEWASLSRLVTREKIQQLMKQLAELKDSLYTIYKKEKISNHTQGFFDFIESKLGQMQRYVVAEPASDTESPASTFSNTSEESLAPFVLN